MINDEITNSSTSVKRDFLGFMFLENSCSPCDVNFVTFCKDDIRNSNELSEFEMNDSSSTRECVTNLVTKKWKSDKIYDNHYRMNGPYIAHSEYS